MVRTVPAVPREVAVFLRTSTELSQGRLGESVGLRRRWSAFSVYRGLPAGLAQWRAPECVVGSSISVFMELKPGEC